MTRKWLYLGVGLIALATTLTLVYFDRLIVPDLGEWRMDQVLLGMTPAEVERHMGREGEPQFTYSSGDPRRMPIRDYFGRRWDSCYSTLIVYFDGPRGGSTAVSIVRQGKNPPQIEYLWWSRIGIALLFLLGGWLTAFECGFEINYWFPRAKPPYRAYQPLEPEHHF